MRVVARVLIVAALFGSQAAHAQNAAFSAALKQATWPVGVVDGKLAGAGAAVLSAAIADAQFVMLGEDHGIAQVPALAAALCGELGPRGFHRLAIEVGGSIAPELERFAARAGRRRPRRAAFTKACSVKSIAFYDWKRGAGDVAARARRRARRARDLGARSRADGRGAGGAAQHAWRRKPGPVARAAIEGLVRDATAARADGGEDGRLRRAGGCWRRRQASAGCRPRRRSSKDGSGRRHRRCSQTLLESRAIYQGQSSATPWLSNRQRARLMKSTFTDRSSTPRSPRTSSCRRSS